MVKTAVVQSLQHTPHPPEDLSAQAALLCCVEGCITGEPDGQPFVQESVEFLGVDGFGYEHALKSQWSYAALEHDQGQNGGNPTGQQGVAHPERPDRPPQTEAIRNDLPRLLAAGGFYVNVKVAPTDGESPADYPDAWGVLDDLAVVALEQLPRVGECGFPLADLEGGEGGFRVGQVALGRQYHVAFPEIAQVDPREIAVVGRDSPVALGVEAPAMPPCKLLHHQGPPAQSPTHFTYLEVALQKPQPFGPRGPISAIVEDLGEVGHARPAGKPTPPPHAVQIHQDAPWIRRIRTNEDVTGVQIAVDNPDFVHAGDKLPQRYYRLLYLSLPLRSAPQFPRVPLVRPLSRCDALRHQPLHPVVALRSEHRNCGNRVRR